MAFMDATPASLIIRLADSHDAQSWDRFARLFVPLLLRWARKLCPQDADAEDLVQEVFGLLVRRMPEFRYDEGGSFRAWLWVLLKRTQLNRLAKRKPVPTEDGFFREQAGDIGEPPLDEAEYQDYLLGRAVTVMKADFQETTWQAFWELTVNERPAAEIAVELGISANAVYLAKSRVLARLRHEMAGLME